MRKIPTLFTRDPQNRSRVLDEYAVELPPDALATPKWDGTCVMFDGARWWARREVKPGKVAPADFDEVAFDAVTGKRQGWVPITDHPQWKWHNAAIANDRFVAQPATYELIGPHFQSNPHGISDDLGDILVMHGEPFRDGFRPATDYEGLRVDLDRISVEGVVWWADGEPVAKIKRSDFGLPWPERAS